MKFQRLSGRAVVMASRFLGLCLLLVTLNCAEDGILDALSSAIQQPAAEPGNISGAVMDIFGSGLKSAEIALTRSGQVVDETESDDEGLFDFSDVPGGSYLAIASKAGFIRSQTAVTVSSLATSTIGLVLRAESLPSAGIIATRSISADDQKLIFEADFFVADADGKPLKSVGDSDFDIPDGTDNSGTKFDFAKISVSRMVGNARGAYSAVLLLDQSGSIIDTDPNDSRIQAAKFFLSALGSGDNVKLSAFASGGKLPHQITYWGNGFTNSGKSYFPNLDKLANEEEGGTPLYRAIASTIVYAAENAPNSNKAVVVFTDGQDTDGGYTIDDLASISKSENVPVYTVGLSANVDRKILSEIAVRTGGANMWASDARQLVSIFGSLGSVLGGAVDFYRTRWSISLSEGSFENGRWLTTIGKVKTSVGTLSVPMYVKHP